MTLAECFARYPDTDKNTIHSYAEVYERLLGPYRELLLGPTLLEVGVRRGGSLVAWADWFPKGSRIYGVDNGSEAGFWDPVRHPKTSIGVFRGDSTKPETLRQIGVSAGLFDIVIDDGCHTPLVQVATWAVLFPYVKPGGIYIIEDVEGITHAQALQTLFGAEIIDRRGVKGRHDDILAVWRAS